MHWISDLFFILFSIPIEVILMYLKKKPLRYLLHFYSSLLCEQKICCRWNGCVLPKIHVLKPNNPQCSILGGGALGRQLSHCGGILVNMISVFLFVCFFFFSDLNVLFIIGDCNAKVGSQEIPGVTANLALEYGMKQVKGQ